MMTTPSFRLELVTKDITYCLISACPQANSCLRYLTYQHSAPFHLHAFVDPRRLTQEQQSCPHYLSDHIVRLGRGFQQAMRRLRYGDVSAFQAELTDALGCRRSTFYNYASGRSTLTPQQQEIIRSVFAEFDITDAELFDHYEEGYILDN